MTVFRTGDRVYIKGEPGEAVYEGMHSLGYAMTNRGIRVIPALTKVDEVKKSEFQVGDKVRTVIGEVTGVHSNGRLVTISFAPGEYDYRVRVENVELIERLKKEPKLGSLWVRKDRDTQPMFMYLGNGKYWNRQDETVVEPFPDELDVLESVDEEV